MVYWINFCICRNIVKEIPRIIILINSISGDLTVETVIVVTRPLVHPIAVIQRPAIRLVCPAVWLKVAHPAQSWNLLWMLLCRRFRQDPADFGPTFQNRSKSRRQQKNKKFYCIHRLELKIFAKVLRQLLGINCVPEPDRRRLAH